MAGSREIRVITRLDARIGSSRAESSDTSRTLRVAAALTCARPVDGIDPPP
jgi:hypothetical protein